MSNNKYMYVQTTVTLCLILASAACLCEGLSEHMACMQNVGHVPYLARCVTLRMGTVCVRPKLRGISVSDVCQTPGVMTSCMAARYHLVCCLCLKAFTGGGCCSETFL